MRHILLIICLLAANTAIFAEGLEFSSTNWDLGTIAEDGGNITHSFEFRNTTDKPVVIHNVRTSCGCTSTDYSRRPIGAGEGSVIGIVFNPKYQAGTISKNVYIYSTASQEPLILTLSGVVTPRVKPLREQYPYTLGEGGRIEMLYLTIPGVSKGDMVQGSVEYINSSDQPLEIEFRRRADRRELKLFYDTGIAAGESATVEIGYFIERKLEKKEVLRDTVDIYVNGKKSDKSLYIKGVASTLF